jgi:hypothetical protein
MGDWRLTKLQDYYQKQQTRKRHCADDSSEDAGCTLQACKCFYCINYGLLKQEESYHQQVGL